jgi:hypothetical protein
MRYILAALFLFGSTLAGAAPEIARDRQIILRGGWLPRAADTNRALRCIEAFLAKNEDSVREISAIRSHIDRYGVQFIGEIHNVDPTHNKKIIFCNFFWVERGASMEGQHPEYRSKVVRVTDGGFGFWRIYYDPQRDTCFDFNANGPR